MLIVCLVSGKVMLCRPASPAYHPIFGDSNLFLKYLVKNDPIFCKFNISHVFS